jgi:hypothetical protein
LRAPRILALLLSLALFVSFLPAASAQAPLDAGTLVAPASALGPTWKLDGGEATKNKTMWFGGYSSTDTASFSGALLVIQTTPSTPYATEMDQLIKDASKAGATVTPINGIGDRAVQVVQKGKKETMVGYMAYAGNNSVYILIGGPPGKNVEIEAAAKGLFDAESALVTGAAPAASAPAPAAQPTSRAKLLTLPPAFMGSDWKVAGEKPGTSPDSYSVDFVPADGSAQAVTVGVLVLEEPGQADAVIAVLADPFRQQGWAIVPQDDYGDRPGLKGTLGSADVAGTLYVIVVGSKVAFAVAGGPPTAAADAAALAEELILAQEARLY